MDVLRPQTRLPGALAVLAVTVGLASAAPGSADAQQVAAPDRGKFILGIGGGYAATKTDCSNCGSGEEEAPGEEGAT